MNQSKVGGLLHSYMNIRKHLSRTISEETETLIRPLDKLSDILGDIADKKGGDSVE